MSTIPSLTSRILCFRDARNWKVFHGPKEMAIAISVEASELLQHFVWQDPAQSEQRVREKKEEIASEMADIAILLFEMAHNSGVDLEDAILQKLERNEQRYPVDKAKDSNKKYNEL